MLRVGRWLGSSRSANASSSSLDVVTEAQNMEAALRAAELIMDDDIEGAERQLATGSSAFHKLARGTLGFMKATMGFEQDVMKQATTMLAEAETSAYQFHQKAQSEPAAFASTIYDKGSEFALCQAEAQIMAAVVGVLNESVTESLKGFYKMRKAYFTLENLVQQEQTFMKARSVQSVPVSRQQSSESLRSINSKRIETSSNMSLAHGPTSAPRPATPIHSSNLRSATSVNDDLKDLKGLTNDDSDSDEFCDVDNTNERTTGYQGHLGKDGELSPIDEKFRHLDLSKDQTPMGSGANTPMSGTFTPDLPQIDPNRSRLLVADPESGAFTNSLDIFIHSGVNLMSGLINLMLSVIPPAFGRLLSIIGFRGDRERGLSMLWQASKFSNINGGMAALIIFGWYNSLIGFCDIISDTDPTVPDDVNGFPIERLGKLLVVMRQRYPKSYLWKLEEARMHASKREVSKAIALLTVPGQKSQLKQLEALARFELSLNAMNAHDYPLCAKSFIECIDLNEWSPALYHYTAASAYLQMYRNNKSTPGQEAMAEENRKLALKHFKEAPTHTGKKKMMGKQLPFDTWVTRKTAKWTARAESWNVPFLDAVGVSPLEEICLFWNGYKKMDASQLETSLANLAWSEDPQRNPHWAREDLDEKAILLVLRAAIQRNLRRHDDARETLQPLLSHDAADFRGPNKDDWTGPTAQYEMAANYWMQRREYVRRYGSTLAGVEADDGELPKPSDLKYDADLVAQAKKYLEKAKNWGSYVLDSRVGIKITAGHGAVLRWETKHKDLVK